jgi:hypothetical protein
LDFNHQHYIRVLLFIVSVIPFSVASHNEGRLDEAAARIGEGFEVLTAVLMKIGI